MIDRLSDWVTDWFIEMSYSFISSCTQSSQEIFALINYDVYMPDFIDQRTWKLMSLWNKKSELKMKTDAKASRQTSVWALSYWFCRHSLRLSDSLRVFLTRSRSSWCLCRRSSARIRSSCSRTVASFAILSSSSSSRNRRLSSDLSSAISHSAKLLIPVQ